MISMNSLDTLAFHNSFASLPEELFTRLQPQGLEQPFLVSANPLAAQLIDLDPQALQSQAFVELFSGNALPVGSDPLAMLYSGHQFGSYNPQLGDGRGILLGQVRNRRGESWDLHLKGAGQTPYSRFGDGRAVLRSSIREYLGSEAMAGLGIASSRALCVIGSKTPVARETMETAATLLRLASSHIRFGHFEYFHYTERPDRVKTLADHVIVENFPELLDMPASTNIYAQFLGLVVERTAEMIARWQAVGFAHGVMNTDNMSILGDTFDFGPFGFLDDYNPAYICNHSDHTGRYAFNRQPGIALWNLNALAHALSSLVDTEQLKQQLARYEPLLTQRSNDLFNDKLGLLETQEGDATLADSLLELLHQNQIDYTRFFRALCDFENNQTMLRDSFVDRTAFDQWASIYQQRLDAEASDAAARRLRMKQVNPKFILRNYLAQNAIEQATTQGDFSEVEHLLKLVQSPFEEHPDSEQYARQPPDWGKKLEISCSS